MPPDQSSLDFLIANIAKLMRRSFELRMRSHSLTLSQARALIYVSKKEGCRQAEIADTLDITPVTLARLIDNLEQSELVERRPDGNDRRSRLIFLRPKADAAFLANVAQVAEQTRREALRNLTDGETRALISALQHVRTNLSP